LNIALNVGLIGCGNISSIYLENSRRFPEFNIIACADLYISKAEEAAANATSRLY
jgi:predicted homoserine dehydrogenase-like protein